MSTELEVKDSFTYQLGELRDLADLAKNYARFARSHNTNKAYASDWNDFEFWCKSKNLIPMPASPYTVAVYITDRATHEWLDYKGRPQQPLKASSLQRRLTSISQAHVLAKKPFDRRHSDILETWKGIRNKIGTAQTKKEPILIEDMREMISSLNIASTGKQYLSELRDRSLLLLGFSGAFRRSELVSLNREDIKIIKEGVVVNLKKSKTDQTGMGREIAIPYGSNPLTCPVRVLQDWIQTAGIETGPLFRPINKHGHIIPKALTAHSVALIIKRNQHIALRAKQFSGHSLRAGFATTAAIAGVPEHIIMRQTGHKKSDTIKRYIRLGNMWKENAASKIGL